MWKCGRIRKWRESFSRNPWDSRIDLTCGRPHVVGVWLIAGKLINFKGGATCAAFSLTLRACNYTDTLARNGNGETIAAWIVPSLYGDGNTSMGMERREFFFFLCSNYRYRI